MKTYTKEEVIEIIKDHSSHIYQGYYVFKLDLEDVFSYDETWIKKKLTKK